MLLLKLLLFPRKRSLQYISIIFPCSVSQISPTLSHCLKHLWSELKSTPIAESATVLSSHTDQNNNTTASQRIQLGNYEWSVDSVAGIITSSFHMSGTGSRENVFATRMALTNTKLRLKSAQTGHSLLAKKRDALTTRFRAILKKVDEVSLANLLFVEVIIIGLG